MAGFRITKEYIAEAFSHLAIVHDAKARGRFFDYVLPDVTWAIAGTSHSLSGTRHTLQSHSDATFNRLGQKLAEPIKFTVGRIILDAEPEADGWWAMVELLGVAPRKSGHEYRNDYVWMTRWNEDGKMAEIKSYFDTYLSELVLNE
ncbi:hypothetical protein O9K51_10159 [Purpureocillium lavendulum]|uniref:SnoaL-like domain-containing protein n=1 Tax=Purpureocillium lavendulum TaxID=1247861 RepID=A0AB34FDS6_9HYPO|nr:hypothetical protein O9K51_10159 [Purpureocillium lavendulum]